MDLSIVVPAFNEADRIVETISRTLEFLKARAGTSEVLVVSDGSTDDTATVVTSLFPPAGNVSVKVLEYHPNRGKGYAVRYGMLNAAGKMVLFMDADYAVPIDEIEKGVALLRAGADIAIGSRAIPGAVVQAHQNVFREFSAKLYTFIQNRYLGIRYKDTQCGFKLFKAEPARMLFGEQRLDSVIFDPEILWLAKRNRFKVDEFPVTWRHVENSRIVYDSLRKSLFVFRELFKIRRLHRE